MAGQIWSIKFRHGRAVLISQADGGGGGAGWGLGAARVQLHSRAEQSGDQLRPRGQDSSPVRLSFSEKLWLGDQSSPTRGRLSTMAGPPGLWWGQRMSREGEGRKQQVQGLPLTFLYCTESVGFEKEWGRFLCLGDANHCFLLGPLIPRRKAS